MPLSLLLLTWKQRIQPKDWVAEALVHFPQEQRPHLDLKQGPDLLLQGKVVPLLDGKATPPAS